MRQPKNERFVDLLASTCSVPGKSIISNQQLITDMVFDVASMDMQSPARLLMPIRINPDTDVVEVLPTVDYFGAGQPVQWLALQTFLETCTNDMFKCVSGVRGIAPSTFVWHVCLSRHSLAVCLCVFVAARYFDSIGMLCAELCRDRYRPAMDAVGNIYPLPVLMRILTNDRLLSQVRVCLRSALMFLFCTTRPDGVHDTAGKLNKQTHGGFPSCFFAAARPLAHRKRRCGRCGTRT